MPKDLTVLPAWVLSGRPSVNHSSTSVNDSNKSSIALVIFVVSFVLITSIKAWFLLATFSVASVITCETAKFNESLGTKL